MPRLKTYHIVALFEVGFYEYDNSFHLCPARLGAAVLPDARCGERPRSLRRRRRSRRPRRPAIAAAFGGHVRIVDWQQANSSIVNAVEIERNVMFLILTLIILVAAFNIISSMIMMVKDKGRDIAILRTMGASRGMVLRIFILSGASIGFLAPLQGSCWVSFFTEHRRNPAICSKHRRRRPVFGRDLFLHPNPGAPRPARSPWWSHGADAVVSGHPLSVLASRPARSGRSAALRMILGDCIEAGACFDARPRCSSA